jgi:hypothetical protein
VVERRRLVVGWRRLVLGKAVIEVRELVADTPVVVLGVMRLRGVVALDLVAVALLVLLLEKYLAIRVALV